MKLTVNDVLKAAPGCRLPFGNPSVEFEGASVDSRNVGEGTLFVGIRGEQQDGAIYAPDALRDGAAAAVISEPTWRWLEGEFVAIGKPVIIAEDPLAAMQAAGRVALERTGATVIGVTGATGKTTTKDILVAMLAAVGVRVYGTPGNRNTEIGVPMSLLEMPADTQVAVIEMGMRGMGQIAELASLAPPTVGCISAIGPVHLELLGSVANVAAAKFELLQALPRRGTAVVPAGDPHLEPLLATLDPQVSVVGFGERPPVELDMDLTTQWQYRCAAAAYACCEAIGHAPPDGTRVEIALSPMRGNIRPLAVGGTLIEDCYNANPIAMNAALADLVARPGRHVAILADMFELGSDERALHLQVGAAAAAAGVDLLIGVGTRSAWYVQGAGETASVHFRSVDDAVAGVGEHLRPDDVVLVKGSRGMALERLTRAIAADAQ